LAWRFALASSEAVQDEHRFRKLDRVYRSIGAAGIVFDDLQHAGTTEPLSTFAASS
jgi:hypothetical protein